MLSGAPPALDELPGEVDAATQAIVAPSSTVGADLLAASIQFQGDNGFADGGVNTYAVPAFGVATVSNHATIKTQPPTSVAAGTAFKIAVTIVDNVTNKTATSYNGNVTISLANNPGGATLSGALTVTARKGVATFSGLSLDKVGTGFTIQASAADVAVGTTRALNVTPGAVAELVLATAPPTNVAAGIGFGLVVTAYDRFGNLATESRGSITASVAVKPAGAQNPGGTLRASAVGGVATFTNIVLKTAGDYTISLAGGKAPRIATGVLRVNPGAAASLVIVAQPPKTVTAGTGFGLSVKVLDAFGNAAVGFTGNVMAALAKNAGGGSLGGTTTVAAVDGTATFTGLTLNKVGNGYRLQVTGVGSKPAVTGTLDVLPGAVTQFALTTPPPGSVSAGEKFKVVVAAQDAQGNKTAGFNGAVSIALASNPGGATLGGTLTVKAKAGVATFNDLTLDKAAADYRFEVASGAASTLSGALNVSPGQATQLVLTAPPPSDIPVGAKFGLVAQVVDRFGNLATNYTSNATVSLLNNSARAFLGGALTTQFINGKATFSNLSLDKIARDYTLQVRSGSLPALTTSTINAFGQVTLSTGQAEPCTSALLTGALINTALPTIVTFTDPYGNQFSVSPTSVDSSGVRFPVPIYMDLTTGELSSGVYSVRLQQQTSSGMVSYGADKELSVADLAPTDVAPGYVLNAFLTQMQTLYGNLLTDWQKIARQASPFVNLSSLTSTIQTSQQQLSSLQSQLLPLINGQVSGIELTSSATMTQGTLVAIDRMLLAQLSQISSVTSEASFTGFVAPAAFATIEAEGPSASQIADAAIQKAFGVIQELDGNYARMLPSLLKVKETVVAGAAIGSTLAAASTGAVLAAPVAGSATAGVVDQGSNAMLLLTGVALRAGANMIRNGGELTWKDFQELSFYTLGLAEQIYVGADAQGIIQTGGGKAVDLMLKGAGVVGRLGGTYTALTAILNTAEELLGDKEQEIVPNFAAIVQNGLTPPVVSVSPGTLTFTVAFGGPPPASRTITVTNSGDVRSTLDFTATTINLPSVTVSGSGNLSGGTSTNLTVSVNTAGLTRGTYTGSILITGDAASNSPVPISVTINVVEPVISVSTSSMTFTVTRGQNEQSQTLAVSNSGPFGTILTYSSWSAYGRVQVTGSQHQLPSGQYDFLTVTTRASNLSVGTYTDYVYVVDSNNVSNYKYVTVTINVQAPPLPEIGGTTDLYFTATQNGPSPASQVVTISNVGASGSSLSWAASLPNNRYSLSGGVSPLSAGYYTTATLSLNLSGLAAGSYLDTITIYSTNDPRVAVKTISVHITITGQTTPSWGAFESGSNGRSSDQWYSISSSQMAIRFWMQPFKLADGFVVSDDYGRVYVNVQFSTEDNDSSIPIQQQHPRYVDFTKPAGVTRLRVQVIPNSNNSTGWWYYGRTPGQLWY